MDKKSDKLFSSAKIPWKNTKEEIWEDMSVRLEEGSTQFKVRRFLPGKQWLALAASFTLLLAVAGFMHFYAVETSCPAGVHATLELPDGSIAELNAETSVRYHPFWWFISRRVVLEGEAYFDVKKGKLFSVISSKASTEVLGTSFNILARNEQYAVTCHSGMIRVTSSVTDHSITLEKRERADMNEKGTFLISTLTGERTEPGWMNNLIMFASTPLRLVFNEIERQFGIIIEAPEEMPYIYSGNFALDTSLESVLTLLCRPFDLVYEQTSGNKYIIHPDPRD
ncbi:MAG: FecR family protein [Bacteroidales bacterium]|nr:FecR family protein [Bacteroidales bacterium]